MCSEGRDGTVTSHMYSPDVSKVVSSRCSVFPLPTCFPSYIHTNMKITDTVNCLFVCLEYLISLCLYILCTKQCLFSERKEHCRLQSDCLLLVFPQCLQVPQQLGPNLETTNTSKARHRATGLGWVVICFLSAIKMMSIYLICNMCITYGARGGHV